MPPPSMSIPTAPHLSGDQTGRSKISPAQVSGALKRKRPPTLEIPNVLREISAQSNPDSSSTSSTGHGFAVSSLKGMKNFMEDTHKALSCPLGVKGFFGVYDGHGGRKAAEFVAENLHTNILDMTRNCTDDTAKEEAVKAGYLKTDREFLKQGVGSGACCLTALIDENEIVVSNLGDCRAVLCRGGLAVALTKDHTAEEECERKRIESQGGYVEMHRGAWRVHGVLSVSRSIGDAHLKDWISAEPDTKILKLTRDMEYLILASDGLWKEVGNQEAVDVVKRTCLKKKEIEISSASVDYQNQNNSTLSGTSPLPTSRRILAVKKQKKTGLKNIITPSRNEFACENENPPPRCLMEKEKAAVHGDDSEKNEEEDEVALGFASRCPSPMSKRVSLVKQKKKKKTSQKNGETGNEFADENEGPFPPPSKARKISFQTDDDDDGFKCDIRKVPILQEKAAMKKSLSLKQGGGFKKTAAASSGGLVAASCNELVKLAVRKGSLDDITVMIIDLDCFRRRPSLSPNLNSACI